MALLPLSPKNARCTIHSPLRGRRGEGLPGFGDQILNRITSWHVVDHPSAVRITTSGERAPGNNKWIASGRRQYSRPIPRRARDVLPRAHGCTGGVTTGSSGAGVGAGLAAVAILLAIEAIPI